MFQGATALNLDVKGRLAVPTRHRDGLQSGDGSKQVLTAHPHRCLLLYPAPAWEPIRAQIMGFSSFDPQTSLWKRLLVGFAEEVELDASGRLLVSPELRKFAGLKKQSRACASRPMASTWMEPSAAADTAGRFWRGSAARGS